MFVKKNAMVALGLLFVGVCPLGSVAWGNAVSEVLRGKGEVLLGQENYSEAIALFEQSVAADPADARAFSFLGRAHERNGDEEKAHKYYRIALRIDPTEQQTLVWSALMDVRDEDIDQAREKRERLKVLCGDCEGLKQVDTAIAKWQEARK